jgi:hypothetical protein
MHRPSWGVTIRSLGVHDLLYFDPAFAMTAGLMLC